MRPVSVLFTVTLALFVGFGAGYRLGGAEPQKKTVKLENKRVKVTEVLYAPGIPREKHVRANDQVIVFLDDCEYSRIDPATGEKTVRQRKSGEVIWHDKGEIAPVLTNLKDKTYRTLMVELP